MWAADISAGLLYAFVLLENKSQEILRSQLRQQASTSRNYYCSERLQVAHTVPSIYRRVSLLQRAAFWELPFTFDHFSLSSLRITHLTTVSNFEILSILTA